MNSMPDRMPLRQFLKELEISTFDPVDFARLMKAIKIVISYHWGQTRLSGAQYEEHLLATGLFLLRLGLPLPVVITGIGHDLLEDTRVPEETIREELGKEIMGMIEAVTEDDKKDYFAEIAHFVAKTKRWEVLFIKMADRYHNLVTIYGVPDTEKQKRKFEETLGPMHKMLVRCRENVPKEWRPSYDELSEEIMQLAEEKKKEL